VALDRQHIEKRDFPIAREGYSRQAVDEHLAALADSIDAHRRAAAERPPRTLANAAAERVQAIVGTAEASGLSIARSADEDAARMREETDREARRIRQNAVQRSRGEIRGVATALTRVLDDLETAEQDVGRVFGVLRSQATRLERDLTRIENEMDQSYAALRSPPGGDGGASAGGAPRPAGGEQ
jgi:peptidoglycan DL-endopeptidase RipA